MKIFATLALIALTNAIHIQDAPNTEDGAPPTDIARADFQTDFCADVINMVGSGPVDEEMTEVVWYCTDVAPCWDDTPAEDEYASEKTTLCLLNVLTEEHGVVHN